MPLVRIFDEDHILWNAEPVCRSWQEWLRVVQEKPVLSNTDLCRQLKSHIETCHILIILLTSLAEREDNIKRLNAEADDYITKPFKLSVLQTKIADIINSRRLYHKKS